MPEWLSPLAAQVGGAGAALALAALWALHREMWFPAATVRLLQARIVELSTELEAERRAHREDVEEGERRLFNALGVADKVTNIVAHAATRRRGAA